MAQRKKKASPKSKSTPKWQDPRYRRLLGLVCLLLGVFLIVALSSYLFTWQYDQDKVLSLSTPFFSSDIQVQNSLGKLGAYLSHALIYWGFGVSAFLLIGVCMDIGWQLLNLRKLQPALWRSVNLFLIMASLSVFLDFAFHKSVFPWGGAFGESVCHSIANYIGQIGLFLLLLTIAIAYFMFIFHSTNYNFSLPQWKNLFQWRPMFDRLKQKFELAFESVDQPIDEKPLRPKEFTQTTLSFPDEEILRPSVPIKGNTNVEVPEPYVEEEPIPKKFESVDTSAFESQQQAPMDDTLEIEVNTGESVHPAVEKMDVQLEDNRVLEPYNPAKDLSRFKQPTLELLEEYEDGNIKIDREELEDNKDQIIRTLLNYKIEITKIRATIGPTVTLYEIVPAPGIRISRIKNLEDDIALSLSALGIRIIAPIPGKGTIGIEVPNKKKQTVSLKAVLDSEKFQKTNMALPIALGKTISNEVFIADLARMPHLLIAGATGQGKSVGINSILVSMLYKKHPSQLKLVLIDPKKVELFPYSKLYKHYLAVVPGQEEPIITDVTKVIYTLNSLCIEMDERYNLLQAARVRAIDEYNVKFIKRKLNPNEGHKYLPLIVLVIDEFADLIMTAGKEVEMPIGRLAQLARAVGIHLIIATQRPSVNIITGIIKANFPARLAYKVTSKIDSRTILDAGGADQLIGRGDMLLSIGGDMVRLQCAFIDTPEVERVLDFIEAQQGYAEPYYLPEYVGDDTTIGGTDIKISELDEYFEEAAFLVVSMQSGSTSMIQRKMKLGYNRAGRIMDQLEAMGIVGPSEGSKPREVLMMTESELMRRLEEIKTMA